ncbi:MAG: molybdenum cofactor guanylyltransferase [Hyphomonadaceae bacterium]
MSARFAQIAGLLMAGGRSRRFGEEKATAQFCGEPLMDAAAHVFAELTCFAVSARPGSGAERHAITQARPVLHDDPALPSGPLAGLAEGLRWAKQRGFALLATAPCDAPLLPVDLVGRLADEIGGAPAAYAVTQSGVHPLCALWRVDLLDTIVSRLRAGEHPPVRKVLTECGAVAVRFGSPDAFANANTKAALAALEQRP